MKFSIALLAFWLCYVSDTEAQRNLAVAPLDAREIPNARIYFSGDISGPPVELKWGKDLPPVRVDFRTAAEDEVLRLAREKFASVESVKEGNAPDDAAVIQIDISGSKFDVKGWDNSLSYAATFRLRSIAGEQIVKAAQVKAPGRHSFCWFSSDCSVAIASSLNQTFKTSLADAFSQFLNSSQFAAFMEKEARRTNEEPMSVAVRPSPQANALPAVSAPATTAGVSSMTTGGGRIALVVGNSSYPGVAALRNPANDASDIAARLKRLRFDVTLRLNVSQKELLRALTAFGDKVRPGSEVLFFYAGHGMQVRGKNYLIPVDAEIKTENAVSSEAVDVDQLLDKLSSARLSMIILDACRNNPFERRFRGGGQGLASINAPTGTLIAYATAPGRVASDGDGRNGLYTQELLAAIDTPGIKVEDVFKRVRANVVQKSGEAQTPWESSSLTGDFYFVPTGNEPGRQQVTQLSPALTSARTPQQIEDELWDAIKDSDKVRVFEEYIRQYPKGRYLGQAKVRTAVLQDAAVAAPTSAPAAIPPAAQQADRKQEVVAGVEWADADNGSDIGWGAANDYCSGKGTGWRLPSVAELQGNYQSGRSTPCGQKTCRISSNSRLSGHGFWTNEQYFSWSAWFVFLHDGDRDVGNVDNRAARRALCVRAP